ncbi:disease resistance protein RPV1 isoform X2 [Lactuca sativa]|uniref:disease resistance protein RPV1 isoform X2 n=1 Tax=Lactuca sativa TaxID=4236 RepID=UPI000CD87F6D|nr:disease resistance protein RPV1 isoform X2 [Lactuca sativa]
MTPNLERLGLERCRDLEKIYAPAGCLKRLIYIDLRGCPWSVSFPFVKQLEPHVLLSLPVLAVKVDPLEDFPKDHTNNLRFTFVYYKEPPLSREGIDYKTVFLDLQPCTKLESVSGSICGLQHLREVKFQGCITEVPNDIDQLKSLEQLILLSTHVKRLPDSVCMLKHLKSLNISDCQHLEELPENLGLLENLMELSLSTTSIQRLPDSVCMLKNLKSLELGDCQHLEELPENLGWLGNLEELVFISINIRRIPDSICMLSHLKSLHFDSCGGLEKLPEDIGQLESLEMLNLGKCESLRDIPNSLCNMKSLNHLYLRECRQVEKLPEDLGNLKLLQGLNIAFTGISHLPHSISSMNGLHVFGSISLLQSCAFATEIYTHEVLGPHCRIQAMDSTLARTELRSQSTQKYLTREGKEILIEDGDEGTPGEGILCFFFQVKFFIDQHVCILLLHLVCISESSEYLQNQELIRFLENFMPAPEPEDLENMLQVITSFQGDNNGSSEMSEKETDMIIMMLNEELQKRSEMASSFNTQNPMETNRSNIPQSQLTNPDMREEDAERAQQVMSSLSPETIDRLIKLADRIKTACEGAVKTKNWLLGRQGFLMVVFMLLFAIFLHWLGFIGN